jgi:ribose-phosphate pyrophosphokinase
MDRGKTGMVLLAGNSHPSLAKEVANHLGIDVGACVVSHNSNRETIVDIKESVRGKDVYLLQTAAENVNDVVMELLIMAYACKTSNCKNIIGVLPCLPYSQQTKMKRRGNISLKLIAEMCVKAGFSHIITVDLHSKESLGFFSCRMDNLRTSPFFLKYIVESIPNYQNTVIVAKNPMAARRATSLADRLGVCIAVLHGECKEDERSDDDGRASPPPNEEQDVVDQNRIYTIGNSLPPMTAKEKPPMYVVGDVDGKVAILIDDIIDDVKPIITAAKILKENGATKVYAMATHGVLSNDAPFQVEQDSCIDQVIVTNTIPLDNQKSITSKIQTVDVSILIAEAIRRIHNKESMAHLFRDVTGED